MGGVVTPVIFLPPLGRNILSAASVGRALAISPTSPSTNAPIPGRSRFPVPNVGSGSPTSPAWQPTRGCTLERSPTPAQSAGNCLPASLT
ncbi:unnamed protein product [Staurois parvus]|uniref:Uncharacterized protein n=1 Tax=Staurois parvus TaxID=386267 RepID=A0ABN9GHD5_9NEOB|nr:unnamed protein product [Staurois parvus]